MSDETEEVAFDPGPLELTVLGFALVYPDRFYELLELREEHFSAPAHRKLFTALRNLYDDDGLSAASTPSIIADKLTEYGVPTEESFALFTAATDHAPAGPDAIVAVKDRLVARALRAAVHGLGNELVDLAGQLMPQDELADTIQARMGEVLRKGSTLEVKTLTQLLDEEVTRMDPETPDVGMGHSTGLAALDRQISGLHGGEVVVIAGRPGMGKSSLLNHLVLNLTCKQGVPGVIFSLEMRGAEYAQRLVCTSARCDIQQARLRSLNPNKRADYLDALEELRTNSRNLFIFDQGSITMARVGATVRRLSFESGVRWVGIDYLQLLEHAQKRNESTNDAIARSSRAAKALALSLDVPVILLSQLNRDCEKRPDKRPILSDLRSSGSIEQDADCVILLHRADHYHEGDEDWAEQNPDSIGVAELIVAKQRNGPIGTVKVEWRKECAAFRDLTPLGETSQAALTY